MDTKIFSFNDIDETAKLIKEGKIVCFPTETVYGIGVICNNEESYKNLIKVKGRAPDKPISLMAASLESAKKYLDISSKVEKVISKFYPGEVTFLLKAKKDVPSWIDLKTGVVGLRVPASKYVLDLINKVGEPMLVTSANKAGEKTSTLFSETYDTFNGLVELIVKGECTSNVASTIVNLSTSEPVLIRQGNLSFDIIKKTWEEAE